MSLTQTVWVSLSFIWLLCLQTKLKFEVWRDQRQEEAKTVEVVPTPCNTTTAAWGGNILIAFASSSPSSPRMRLKSSSLDMGNCWWKEFQTSQLSGARKRDNDKEAMDFHWYEMRAEPSPFYSQFVIIYLQREWTLVFDQTQCGPEDSFIYLCNNYFGGLNICFLCKMQKIF